MFRGLLLATALILGAQAKAEPKSKQYPIETEDYPGYQPKHHLSYRPKVHPGYPTNPYKTYGYDYQAHDNDYTNLCYTHYWVDYIGNDMDRSLRKNKRTQEGCQNYCANLDGCNYWTWKNNQLCLPKTSTSGFRHTYGEYTAVSGNKACGVTFRDGK